MYGNEDEDIKFMTSSNNYSDMDWYCLHTVTHIYVFPGKTLVIDYVISGLFIKLRRIVGSVKCTGDMTELFCGSDFTSRGKSPTLIDIVLWDVSSVTCMKGMFRNCIFRDDFYFHTYCDISSWDVSSVKDMSYLFEGSNFDRDISLWDVSSVRGMKCMFHNSEFNGDISEWDVSSATSMEKMFGRTYFDGGYFQMECIVS